MFNKILIANRGEIACRVMRTAREMGVATVAVYSDADENALHVREADEAVHIGASLAAESYLNIGKIIEAAKNSGAEAIHPGYGFLSENPEFVEAVEAAGLVFIGPSADAIRAMGLKDAAKVLMVNSGVPVVPGYHGENQDANFLADEAEKIGFPVLIKARAGGGGKGMRLVEQAQDFAAGLEGAVREGQASFGDGHVLIEKYISSPRHIEIQVFGDSHGNVVHMFERDCSLQRRHQKVIEEAPAPGMTDEMRAAMGEAAVKAAQAVNYSGAGTVEFIVDGSDGLRPDRFWFMEMNTRLQVEHPVTEMITGLDLVELQLRVASGEALPFAQDDLSINGWAFEARIYAEDPANGFLPSVGELHWLQLPHDGARVETGVEQYDEVSSFYDPMIAKIVTHCETREDALAALDDALCDTCIGGVTSNAYFLRNLCRDQDFSSGNVQTGLIGDKIDELTKLPPVSNEQCALAAVISVGTMDENLDDLLVDENKYSSWRHWGAGETFVDLIVDGDEITCKILGDSNTSARVWVKEEIIKVAIPQPGYSAFAPISVYLNDNSHQIWWNNNSGDLHILEDGLTRTYANVDPLESDSSDASDTNSISAPMPGLIKAVKVKTGDVVEEGQVLMILEAMKMEHSLVAPRDGVVDAVNSKQGDQIEDGALLVSLEEVISE